MKKSRIYLDYASLTPIDKRVSKEMSKYYSHEYANASSIYKEGVSAKKVLGDMRKKVAELIHAHSDEIVFTSGGTESNGLSLEGAGRAARRSEIGKPHIIISSIEHSSIMEVVNMMEKNGCEVTRLKVDKGGIVDLDELRRSIKSSTYMVSIMYVNNEIGTVEPIKEVAKIIRHTRVSTPRSDLHTGRPEVGPRNTYPLLHIDAAQAALFQDINMEKLGVDLMTLDGSKIYGPRGVGCLYVKRNTPIEPIIYGGGQEAGMRSGTENIPSIVGFAKALELASIEKEREVARIQELKLYFINKLKVIRPDITVNGWRGEASLGRSGGVTSPHILNISIPGIDNEYFVLQLDASGIACSTKSSCLRDVDESYVLRAIGGDSKNSVRFSLGRWTKKRDIDKALTYITTFC